MKTPILFNAEPVKTDVKPVLVRGTYDVFVGAIDEDSLPVYVVINRATGVVEYTSEVLQIINEWLDHFTKDQLSAQKEKAASQLNLALNS